jgi:hypothetical protein
MSRITQADVDAVATIFKQMDLIANSIDFDKLVVIPPVTPKERAAAIRDLREFEITYDATKKEHIIKVMDHGFKKYAIATNGFVLKRLDISEAEHMLILHLVPHEQATIFAKPTASRKMHYFRSDVIFDYLCQKHSIPTDQDFVANFRIEELKKDSNHYGFHMDAVEVKAQPQVGEALPQEPTGSDGDIDQFGSPMAVNVPYTEVSAAHAVADSQF